MQEIALGKSRIQVSRLAYGCWRIVGASQPTEVTPRHEQDAIRAVLTAWEAGYRFFDHADIYAGGLAETFFGQALQKVSGMRDQVVIATKCGIRRPGDPNPDSPYRYDASAFYIMAACDRSLKRLGIETIDLYQIHRPDYLLDPCEVAMAFTELKRAGKVREFGVSNFSPSQVTALQKACPMPLVVNQVEISLVHLAAFENGVLDQCLSESMIPMAWSPLAGGLLGQGARKLLPAQERYKPEPVLSVLDNLASKWGVSRSVIALAWLLKHPANIIPIVGSTHPARILEAVQAENVELTREEWYRLLAAGRGEPLP